MLATFCVRLALGLNLFSPMIWNCLPHSRFLRTQFLTVLGLIAVATVIVWGEADGWQRGSLLAGAALSLAGALAWTLDPAPAGRILIIANIAALIAALFYPALVADRDSSPWIALRVVNEIASASLLGSAMTAMLIGHSYLIAPGFALTPSMRTLWTLFLALSVRTLIAVGALVIWLWSADAQSGSTEVWLWLPVRWLVGMVAPMVFGCMALSAAKIRSTQSATGILYVVVVCTILGELIGQLLARQTGLPL